MTMKTINAGADTSTKQEPLLRLLAVKEKTIDRSLPDYFEKLVSANRRILRFILVGGTSVLVDLLVYWILGQFYAVFWSKLISYIAGMIVGFFGNKYYTFQSHRRSWYEPLTYTLLYAVTLSANVATCWGVHAGVESLGVGWGATIGFFVATGVSTVLNYFGMSLITFRSRDPS